MEKRKAKFCRNTRPGTGTDCNSNNGGTLGSTGALYGTDDRHTFGGVTMFEKLNKFFRLGLYTKAQLHKFVEKGVITEEQYQQIVADA